MGKRLLIGCVATLTAVVGTAIANATPSPTWGPVTCAGGQATAVWNKAKLAQVTFAWYSESNPDGHTALDSTPMAVTTHPPKGSMSASAVTGAGSVRVYFATDAGDPFPPFVDATCS